MLFNGFLLIKSQTFLIITQNSDVDDYFLANEIFMECVGVILNPFKASRAAPL